MPLTRNTYGRKKSQNEDENNKENIQKEEKVRQSKFKAMKKIEEHLFEEPNSLTISKNSSADPFDLLCSSPMKQEVNFKPLSFWSKKVKDLECKETKKKKCQLYELSDTDDSSIEGKNIKKKGKAVVGRNRKKTQKKQKLITYNIDPKKLKKRDEIKAKNNKDGSIVREKIILQRLNDKLSENEEKFSLNKISDFGLTSTPGKKMKLNLVGGSAFNFLSPVTCNRTMPVIRSDDEKEDKSFGEEHEKTVIEPKKVMRERICEKDEIKTLKRNPVSNISRVITTKNHFEFSCDDFLDKIVNHQISYEDNMMNTTLHFLNITDDEFIVNEEDVKIVESVAGGDNTLQCNTSSNLNMFSKIDVTRSLILLERLLKLACTELNYDNNATQIENGNFGSDRGSIAEILSVSLMNFTVPLRETKFNRISEQLNLSFIHVNSSIIHKTENESSHESFIYSIKNASFSNIQVRRYYNFFLNFRRSEKMEDNNLFDDNNTEICVNDVTINTKACVDVLRCTSPDSCSYVFDSSYENNLNLESAQNSSSHSLEGSPSKENILAIADFRDWDQQTQENETELNNITVVGNSGNLSNQYCSNQTLDIFIEENTKLCFNIGNDSSEIIKSSETDTEAEIECSICKKTLEGKDGRIKEEIKIPSRVSENLPETTLKPQRMEFNNVTCFRGTKASRHKKPSERNIVENNDNKIGMTVSCSPVVVKRISAEMTFNDEFDFPVPIFESTACQSPRTKGLDVKGSELNDGKGNLSEETSDRVFPDSASTSSWLSDAASIRLKPGKKWARSAIVLKKTLNGSELFNEISSWRKKGRRFQTFVREVLDMQNDTESQSTARDCQKTMLPIDNLTNKISNLKINYVKERDRTIKIFEETGKECNFQNLLKNSFLSESVNCFNKNNKESSDGKVKNEESQRLSARDQVLLFCKQEAPLPFEKYFNERTLKNCKKIGEGTFGEVFMCNPNRVFKVIPIEGPDEVNGDRQKLFEEIITEMIIAMELSNLRNAGKCRTSCFCELKRCWCVVGKYPEHLLDLWNDFDCVGNGSENDSPEMFESDQLYIILEFGNGGSSLEAFVFNSAEQALSIFIQPGSVTCCTDIMTRSMLLNEIKALARKMKVFELAVAFGLAVAEKVLEFEHRDLHWGNILIAPTREKYFRAVIDSEEYKIPTKGVKATIIDFTLSRISYNGCTVFNDLALDPALFISQGDYQFEIYRLMKNELMNDWSLFRPKTNLFWLHYVLDKMLKMVHYKKTGVKNHNVNITKMMDLKCQVLEWSNCEEFILSKNLISYCI